MLLDYCVSSSRWHILHRVIKGNKNGRQCKKSKNINSKTSCQHQFASSRQTLTKKGMHLHGSRILKQSSAGLGLTNPQTAHVRLADIDVGI